MKRWKPEYDEQYFLVDLTNLCVGSHLWENDVIDNLHYQHGNCFKTKKEATAKLKQIKQILKNS